MRLPFYLFAISSFTLCFVSTARDSADSSPAPAEGELKAPAYPSTGIGPTLELNISRRPFKNFLTDEIALEPYLGPEGTPLDFDSVFVVGSLQAKLAVFWDPIACRMLGVLDLEGKEKPGDETLPSTYPYILQASGPPPLSPSSGAIGDPEYFGFRLVDGAPEFLYTFGSLVVEERIWLENLGKTLKQQYSFRGATSPVSIAFPEEWKSRVKPSTGTWKDNVLTIPTESTGEIVLTYQLSQPKPDTTN